MTDMIKKALASPAGDDPLVFVMSDESVDRTGDVIAAKGWRLDNFIKNPVALFGHDPKFIVGHWSDVQVKGRQLIGRLNLLPKGISERLDEIRAAVEAGVLRAVSVGFASDPDHRERNKHGGISFKSAELLECSLVSVPMNQNALRVAKSLGLSDETRALIFGEQKAADSEFQSDAVQAANGDCSIQTIKSIDTEIRAALGKAEGAARPVPPGASGTPTKTVKLLKPKEKPMATPIAEQISAFEATLAAKSAELEALMTETEGETLDAEKAEKADDLTAEIKSINDHLKRLNTVQALKASTAKPVQAVKSVDEGTNARQAGPVVQAKRNVEKGIIFTRLLGAKYLAYKHHMNAVDIAKSKFGDTPEVETILKSAVAAGTTTDSVWASPLVELTNATGEFIELLRPATIIGRLNGLRRVPFNIKVPRGTQDPTAYWVGEASPKPVSSMAFDSIELAFNKVAGIVPMTEELMRFSNPAAEGLVRDGLVASIAYLTDRDFLDPTNAGESGVKPASVTYNVTPVTVTGTSADHFRADLGSLIAKYLAANMSVAGLVLVMTSVQAMRLALMRNTLGQREFPDITASGGTIEGIPVVTSENLVPTNNSPADGYPIVAINAPEVYLADDGGVDIDISREASLQMDNSPDSPTTASTVLVSLWQRNMVAIKAERFITWKKRQAGAVQYIHSAKYA